MNNTGYCYLARVGVDVIDITSPILSFDLKV